MEFNDIANELGITGERPQTVVRGAYLRALRKLRWPPDKRHGRDFLGNSAANIEWRLKHHRALIAKCRREYNANNSNMGSMRTGAY